MPRLFLSYNRQSDGDGKLVRELVKDLTDEIVRISTWPRDDVFYRDLNERLGEDWRVRLVTALGECDVFVPLVSPAYFLSEACGKEWWLFEQRIGEHAARHDGQRPAAIVPIMWERLEEADLPDVASRLNYVDVDTEELYGDSGLRRLVAHPKRHDKRKYRRAREVLARKLKEVAEAQSPLDISQRRWDFDTAESSFGVPVRRAGDVGRRTSATRRTGGWKQVHFVVAAATTDEMSERPVDERPADHGRYGYESIDWDPYLRGDPLVAEASSVALGSSPKLNPSSFNIDRNLGQLITEAEEQRKLVILIVDPRTLQIDDYCGFVEPYKHGNWLHTGVVVAWDEDKATVQRRPELEAAVSSVFRVNQRKALRGLDRTYSDSAGSLAQVKDELQKVIVLIQALLMDDGPDDDVRRARPIDPADPDDPAGPPQLDGPRES